ncbi:MAG: sugar transferase [Candidatus Kapaibacterium sp.]
MVLKYPSYKYFYAAADFITLSVAFIISQEIYLYYFSSNGAFIFNLKAEDFVLLLSVNIMFIFIFHYFNLYKLGVFLTRANQIVTIIKSLIYGLFVIVVISFFAKFNILTDSRLTILIFFFISLNLFIIVRVFILFRLYSRILSKTIFKRKILVVGAGKSGQLFAQKLAFENYFGNEIIGFVDDSKEIGSIVLYGLKVLGSVKDLSNIYNTLNFDEIIICIDKIEYEKLLQIIDECKKQKTTVKVVSNLFGIIADKFLSENYENISIADVSTKINLKLYAFFKRFIDVIGASLGMLFILPFFIVVGIIIKLSSKGPVIFKQVRIGKDGRAFHFYKFRSMRVIDGEDDERIEKMLKFMKESNSNASDKIVTGSRITGIGNFLRKYSLDELPQLFNVIKGDMSLVGPRPCLPYEYQNYDEWQKRRLSVMPGCTGLWQVSGRSEVSFNDSVIMDLYYINNITPWLDLQIIFKTIPVMILAKGGK